MILFIGISPIVLIVLGAVLIINLPVAAVIALVVTTAVSLMGSLAIYAAMAYQMAPKIRRGAEWTYTINPVYRAEALPTDLSSSHRNSLRGVNDGSRSDWPSAEVSGSSPISDAERPKTYLRMIGRRVVEYDAVTHEPVNGYGRNDLASEKVATPLSSDPDQTMPIRRIKD